MTTGTELAQQVQQHLTIVGAQEAQHIERHANEGRQVDGRRTGDSTAAALLTSCLQLRLQVAQERSRLLARDDGVV